MTFKSFYRLVVFLVLFICACLSIHPAAWGEENGASVRDDAYAFTDAYDRRDYDGIAALVDSGLDVNGRTHSGMTPLSYVADNGEDEAFALSVARLLIANGAQVNGEDSFGRVPLIYAIEAERNEIVELLLESGADVTLVSSAYRMPIVFVPFMRQNADLARMLVPSCPDPNIRDSLGNTPLSWASRFGYLDSVKILLDRGANVDNLSIHNKSPLMEAAEKGHYEIAALLVGKGAAIDTQTKKGWSALMWAAEKGYDDILSLLIGAKADLFLKNNKGERALDIAKKKNHPQTADIINKAERRYRLRLALLFVTLAVVIVIVTVVTARYFVRKRRGDDM